MKRAMFFYDRCKLPIRVSFIGFIFLAIGFLIGNENVNLFYTIRNTAVLFIGEACLHIGQTIILNLPIIFMVNLVCKKAYSGVPIIATLVGYFTFTVVVMLLADQNLGVTAYQNASGIDSALNIASSGRYPYETGMIGAFLVAFMTRFCFIRSRHKSAFSFLGFLNQDSAVIIYNCIGCALLGVGVTLVYPTFYHFIQVVINYIAKDLMDPLRIAVYGLFDRMLSILGLGNIIRYPFWYTALGGSYSNPLTGQSVLGDVNIWTYIKGVSTTYVGAGRFITPYYVINLFIIPAIFVGLYINMSDKVERSRFFIPMLLGCVMSVVAGNPLPMEFVLLFTSPLLLLGYLCLVSVVYYLMVRFGFFLGFTSTAVSTVTAMPGAFPDYIINLRSAQLFDSVVGIASVGLVCFFVMLAMVTLYYRFFAFDISNLRTNEILEQIFDAVGGYDNIDFCGSGLFRVNIGLTDLEKVNFEKVRQLGVKRVVETKDGISVDFGSSSHIIARRMRKRIAKLAA